MSTSATSNAHTHLPTEPAISELAKLHILDDAGQNLTFGSLFADKDTSTLVVFIRHFWCGKCKLYVTDLNKTLSRSYSLPAPGRIVIIGCGSPDLIKSYKADLTTPDAPFLLPIYADPTRSLYKALNLVESLDLAPKGQKPSYLTTSGFAQVMGSIGTAVSQITSLGKQGDFKQNGGEFVFGPGMTCTYAHRMRNTEDHTEVDDVLAAIGLEKKAQ